MILRNIEIIRCIKAIRWSQTHRCWYLPLSKESYLLINRNLEGRAFIDTNHLKSYLEQRRAVKPLIEDRKVSKQRVHDGAYPVWQRQKGSNGTSFEGTAANFA